MGYNGSNRKLRSSMFPKSSTRRGSSMLFGRKGIVTGLFDVSGGIVESMTFNSDNLDEEVGTIGKTCAWSMSGLLVSSFFISLYFIADWWMFFAYLGAVIGFALVFVGTLPAEPRPIYGEKRLSLAALHRLSICKLFFACIGFAFSSAPFFSGYYKYSYEI